MQRSDAWIWVLALAGAWGGASHVRAGTPQELGVGPTYTLAPGIGIADALPQLLPEIRVAVADEIPARLTLGKGIRKLPLRQTLDRLSSDLDRYWVRRGAALALQCRSSRADEGPGIEIEELRAAAGDLAALLRAAGPQFGPIDFIRAKQRFADTLTEEQQRVMLADGLPLALLPRDVQQAWLQINNTHAYGEAGLEIRRLSGCLTRWEQTTLRDLTRDRQALVIQFPGPEDENGVGMAVPILTRRSLAPRGEGEDLPTHEKPRAELQIPWALNDSLTLGTVAQRLREAGGPSLKVPQYAVQRRLHVYSSGGTRAEILWAIADLWGWELSREGDGYRLGRTPRRAPGNANELHTLMRRAVPPATWHAARAVVDGNATEHWGDQMDHVLAASDKSAGKGWTQLPVRELGAESQQRLANVAAFLQIAKWYRGTGKMPTPPLWMSRPDLGRLRLSGPLRAGEHPLLSFEVEDADRKRWTWGWYVGTNTLKK